MIRTAKPNKNEIPMFNLKAVCNLNKVRHVFYQFSPSFTTVCMVTGSLHLPHVFLQKCWMFKMVLPDSQCVFFNEGELMCSQNSMLSLHSETMKETQLMTERFTHCFNFRELHMAMHF